MIAMQELRHSELDPKTAVHEFSERLQIPSRTPRILLAEDDVEMRRFLIAQLQLDGYEVIEAQHGPQLLEQLYASQLDSESFDIELVVSDVRMPGISGLEILRGLRRFDEAPPVILITAFGTAQLHAEAKRLGAVGMFDKPFDMDEFRSFVRKIVPPQSLIVGGKPPAN
jgi:DNA-binding response OmpR family regulator